MHANKVNVRCKKNKTHLDKKHTILMSSLGHHAKTLSHNHVRNTTVAAATADHYADRLQ